MTKVKRVGSRGAWIVAAVALAGCIAPAVALGTVGATVEGCINDGAPIPQSSVLYEGVNSLGEAVGPSFEFPAVTGCYKGEVQAGKYRIHFAAPHHERQYYSGVPKASEATIVTLVAGQTYGFSPAMIQVAEVRGKVYDAVTGTPLQGWKVVFTSPKLLGEGVSGFDAYTQADGTYLADFGNSTEEGAGPGQYEACAIQEGTFENYMPACLPSVNAAADTITANIDLPVMEAGQISGTILNELGKPDTSSGLTITAFDAAGHVLATTEGAGTGTYSINIPVGSAYLLFHQPPYADQFYSGKGGLACADAVSATFNGFTKASEAVRMSTVAPSACPSEPGGTGGTGGAGGGGTGGGGATGGGGGNPGPGATVSSAAILSALGLGLAPSGHAARISAILKTGGYVLSVGPLESGTELVQWYLVPHGAHLAKAKRKPAAVLVASGHGAFTGSAAQKLHLTLTSAGRALLRHAKHVTLVAKGTFTPTGQAPLTARRTFKLSR